jgi:hypothetical protein
LHFTTASFEKLHNYSTTMLTIHLDRTRGRGACHTAALPFTLMKKYLKAKEELRKLKYFTMQKYNSKKYS